MYSDLKSERKFLSRFIFPQDVALTSWKPDVVAVSRAAKILYNMGTHLPTRREHRQASSREIEQIRERIGQNLSVGWTLCVFAGEVGAKGWIPPSFSKDLRRIFGFSA